MIKKEKAEYVVINKFATPSFPYYYDGSCITTDDTKEVVYSINNISDVQLNVIEILEWYAQNNFPVKYVNQDIINDSRWQSVWEDYWGEKKLITCARACGNMIDNFSKPKDQFIKRVFN